MPFSPFRRVACVIPRGIILLTGDKQVARMPFSPFSPFSLFGRMACEIPRGIILLTGDKRVARIPFSPFGPFSLFSLFALLVFLGVQRARKGERGYYPISTERYD